MFKDEWKSNTDVIMNIINSIISEKNKKLLRYSDTIDKYTPKKDSREIVGRSFKKDGGYNKSSFHNLNLNYYKNIIIKPEIIIDAYFVVDRNCYDDRRDKMTKEIKKNLIEYIVPVYFDIIKCKYNFTVKDPYVSSGGHCEIKITLDI
jgi:hypothetical protein